VDASNKEDAHDLNIDKILPRAKHLPDIFRDSQPMEDFCVLRKISGRGVYCTMKVKYTKAGNIELALNDACEFMSRKDYTDDWKETRVNRIVPELTRLRADEAINYTRND